MLVGPAGLLLEIRPALFRRGQRAPSRSRTGGDGLDFCGSEDPTDKARTFRVLTIMQASAWESMAGRRRFRMAMAATREQLGDDDADDHDDPKDRNSRHTSGGTMTVFFQFRLKTLCSRTAC